MISWETRHQKGVHYCWFCQKKCLIVGKFEPLPPPPKNCAPTAPLLMCIVCVSMMGFCKCVRAIIVIQDGGELPCKQDPIQFLILCRYLVRCNNIRFILYVHNFCRRYCFTAITSMIPFLHPLIIIVSDPWSWSYHDLIDGTPNWMEEGRLRLESNCYKTLYCTASSII